MLLWESAHFVACSRSRMALVCVRPLLYIYCPSCAWPEVYICPSVASCACWCRSIYGWNEDRKGNQCSRCLRAYRFPFRCLFSGETKKDKTWVNELPAEVLWGNATRDFWHSTCYICWLQHRPTLCWACVCVPVCVNSAGGMAGVSAGSYQCVTERGTMRRIDAKPTATLQVYSAFYSPHSSKRRKIFLSLPLCLSLRSHCILWSVLLFKCSYSPFRRRVTFKPTVTMATPICIWKSVFEGANKMCNNMPWHCASVSKLQ